MELGKGPTRIESLTGQECLQLLATQEVGRVAVIVGYKPHIFPVNYVLDGESIVFRSDEGAMLFGATESGHSTAFEIDGVDPEYHTGWSVVAVGRAVAITGPSELGLLAKIGLQPWAPGEMAHWVRIEPETLTGQRLTVRDRPAQTPQRDDEG